MWRKVYTKYPNWYPEKRQQRNEQKSQSRTHSIGQSPTPSIHLSRVLEWEERESANLGRNNARHDNFPRWLGPSAHNPKSSVWQVNRKSHTRKSNLRRTTAEQWKTILSQRQSEREPEETQAVPPGSSHVWSCHNPQGQSLPNEWRHCAPGSLL